MAEIYNRTLAETKAAILVPQSARVLAKHSRYLQRQEEPDVRSLGSVCSTTELRPLGASRIARFFVQIPLSGRDSLFVL
jgi:hypothetical protein